MRTQKYMGEDAANPELKWEYDLGTHWRLKGAVRLPAEAPEILLAMTRFVPSSRPTCRV